MSIWQTNSWQKLLLKSNQASKVFEVDNIFIEKRSLGLGQYGFFVLGVSFLSHLGGKIEIGGFENKLIDLCKKEKSLFIQIETYNLEGKNFDVNLKYFKSGYYKKFIIPYTAIIDLEKTQDEILLLMKPKGRYNIKLATKKGVEVFEAKKTRENIKIFYNLMLETTSRDKFNGNTFSYYENFLNIIPNSSLIFTKYENKILSAGIFTFDKYVSIYYYGASTSDRKYRNLMATYLMQWFAIKKAKEFNSKYYDFLGIADPNDKNSSLAGVTDFKLKFSKNTIKCSSSYIFINNKLKYKLFLFIKKLKQVLVKK